MKNLFTLLIVLAASINIFADDVTPNVCVLYSPDDSEKEDWVILYTAKATSSSYTTFTLEDTYNVEQCGAKVYYSTTTTSSNLAEIESITIVALGNGSSCIANFYSEVTTIELGSKLLVINDYAFNGFSKVTTFTINTSTPPTVSSNSFTGLSQSSITLYVPSGSKSLYEAADYWKEFGSIIELNSSSISEVSVTEGTIKLLGRTVSLSEEQAVIVYDITGKVVLHTTAQQFTLPQNGIYIIRTENETKKVVVR